MQADQTILSNQSPRFADAQVLDAVREVFGLTCEIVQRLASERDQVLLLEGPAGGYVVKVSNAAELETNVEFENEAILWAAAADPDLPLAVPLPTRQGTHHGDLAGHLLRLYPQMPGVASVPGASLDAETAKEYGRTAARFSLALRGFFHAGAGRKLLWHAESIPHVQSLTSHLVDPIRRALVERCFARFTRRVTPHWSSLRAQVVHSDLTLDNVMLAEGHVSGIIDWGDLTHTALVADVAAALTSLGDVRTGDDLFVAFRLFLDGYEQFLPLEPIERHVLGDIVAARLAMTVTISAWQAAEHPNNGGYLAAWEDAAWSLLEQLDALGSDEIARRLGSWEFPDQNALIKRRDTVFSSAMVPLTYDEPVYLASGVGAVMTEVGGRQLLDAYNNIPSIGYAHPRVARAVADQMRSVSTNLRYLHPRSVELAERLLATMPADLGLDSVLFVNSGSEACDLAWRIAQAATGKEGALVTDRAFHSISMAGTELSPGEWLQDMPMPRVASFAPGGTIDAAIGRLAGQGVPTGALFIDPIYGSDGIWTFGRDYHQALSASAHEAGIRVVVDEVQAGYGRTGDHLWGFASSGLRPDVVVLGKPMGNGYPIAAVVARSADIDALGRQQELFSSFAGSPVAAVAGLAVLDVIRDEGLVEEAARKGEYLRARLAEELPEDSGITEIRGRGLILGIHVGGDGALGRHIVDYARTQGVLLSATGWGWDTIKVRPPLVITDAQLDVVARTIGAAVAATPVLRASS